MNGTFPPHMPRPISSTPYMCLARHICAVPYMCQAVYVPRRMYNIECQKSNLRKFLIKVKKKSKQKLKIKSKFNLSSCSIQVKVKNFPNSKSQTPISRPETNTLDTQKYLSPMSRMKFKKNINVKKNLTQSLTQFLTHKL